MHSRPGTSEAALCPGQAYGSRASGRTHPKHPITTRLSSTSTCKRVVIVSISDDLKAFIAEHREHGQLTGDATEPGLAGYQVWIACPCGRYVPPAGDRRRRARRPGRVGHAELVEEHEAFLCTLVDREASNIEMPQPIVVIPGYSTDRRHPSRQAGSPSFSSSLSANCRSHRGSARAPAAQPEAADHRPVRRRGHRPYRARRGGRPRRGPAVRAGRPGVSGHPILSHRGRGS